MKKSILIFAIVLIALSLTAFNIINGKDSKSEKTEATKNKELALNTNAVYEAPIGPILKTDSIKTKPEVFEDFIYDVGSRFAPMKKSDLEKATSLDAFFTWEELRAISKIKFVEIIVIENERQTQKREISYTKDFTEAQLKLLQSLDYTSHFNLRIEYLEKNSVGQLEHKFNSPHITIVPEKQAAYVDGKAALKKHLKESSNEARKDVDPEKLQAAKLHFTITKLGTIEKVKLDRTSNYPLVDKTMIDLIKNLSGKWKPAENEKGEKMDQEMVVSFGLMGC
jgi:hypothetical protein